MRSRYSAFVTGDVAYIVGTTLPAQQPLLDIEAIGNWSRQNEWLGLHIIQVRPKLPPRHAQVEFKACFRPRDSQSAQTPAQPHPDQYHQELSGFVQVDQRWYFLDPTVIAAGSEHKSWPPLKSACFCGSGQKFKRCCAPFLGLL